MLVGGKWELDGGNVSYWDEMGVRKEEIGVGGRAWELHPVMGLTT